MSVLGLLLESAAVGAVLSAATALVSLVVTSLVSGRSASLRADVAFVAAIAPALVVGVALAATLSSSVLGALGIKVADHCPSHAHHPHLCLEHFGGLRPAAAVIGAAALGFIVVRATLVVARHLRMARTISAMEALGTSTAGPRSSSSSPFPTIELPGAPRVCHAVGITRRRVLVSQRVRHALSARAWDAVYAHEVEHLRRRDPLASLLVELALVLAPPVLAGALGNAFRRSVEGACDAAAAHRLGGGITVAEGLLEAARLIGKSGDTSSSDLLSAPAATEHALEERVRSLLDLEVCAPRGPMAFTAGCLFFVALLAGASFGTGTVHHVLETLLVFFS